MNDLQIGRWTVKPSLFRIVSGDDSRILGPKVMAVLLRLALEPGEVVQKDELIAAGWEGAFTSDEALTTVVYELRKVLGDDARRPTYVETIRSGGYRLIASISPASPAHREHGRRFWPAAAGVAAVAGVLGLVFASLFGMRSEFGGPAAIDERQPEGAVRSLAVLPLEIFNEGGLQEFFAEGLTDFLVADLADVEALDIIATTAEGTPEAAWLPEHRTARLSADALLEGSILRTEDRIWMSVQLVDTLSGRVLWGGNFDRRADDSLNLQMEIARELAQRIRIHLESHPRGELRLAGETAPEASEAFRLGTYFLRQGTPESHATARRYFSEAIALDPGFARGHVGLAEAYLAEASTGTAPSRASAIREAKAATETALALDGGLAEAHATLAGVYFRHGWDFRLADRHFRAGSDAAGCSLESLRHYAGYLSALGRHEAAVTAIERTVDCDPASKAARVAVAWVYYLARRYDEALVELNRARELDPRFLPASWLASDVLLASGRAEEAVRACQRAMELAGDSDERVAALGLAFEESGLEGMLRCLVELGLDGTFVDPLRLAGLEARLGNDNAAFEWLQRAFDERHQDLVWLQVDPAFDRLRDSARFDDIVERLELNS